MSRSRHQRAAFTLVELSITMAAGGTLMMLAIGLVHQTMSLSATDRQHCDHQRATDRLAAQFRSDVNQAQSCTVESGQNIELILPGDDRIQYEADGNQLIRLQPLGDGTVRRESFRLDEHASASFELLDEPARAAVTIRRQAPHSNLAPRIDRHVSAVVGRRIAHQQGALAP